MQASWLLFFSAVLLLAHYAHLVGFMGHDQSTNWMVMKMKLDREEKEIMDAYERGDMTLATPTKKENEGKQTK